MVSSYSHFVVQHKILFFLYGWVVLNNVYTPFLFMHSLVDGHLSWFHILTVVNWFTLNMGAQINLSYADLISFWWFPKVKWLDHTAVFFSNFWAFYMPLSLVVAVVSIPKNNSPLLCMIAILDVVRWSFIVISINSHDDKWSWVFLHISVCHSLKTACPYLLSVYYMDCLFCYC